MDEIQRLTAQRDRLARYIFERNDGDLYVSHCRREVENGRCPYRDYAKDTECDCGVCVPCIVAMIGKVASAPPSPFFFLLAEYHILVTYFVIGGTLGKGRVQMVQDGTITFKEKGKTKRYRLDEIDVIVPMEVLRWCDGKLTPVTWQAGIEGCAEQEEPVIPHETISACLLSIGIQPFMEGITELEAAVRLAVKMPELLARMGDGFYPALAEQIGGSVGTLSYRISKLLGIARRNSRDTGNYYAFYSAIPGRNVSVKAFLLAFSQYMSQREAMPPEL